MRTPVVAAALLALLAPAAPAVAHDRPATPTASSADRAAPRLVVRTVARGLDHPWDVRPIGNGRLLVTERKARLSVVRNGRSRTVRFPRSSVWVSGETGLMGLEVDPGFARNRRFYTCQGGFAGGNHDVRVIAWRLNRKATRATFKRRLVAGIPATSGRHGGCRLLVARDGSLLVGTGDAAVGTNPRDLGSLGGKTLRLDRFTGRPWPTNPFIGSSNPRTRYLFTYGHRNVQGLAQRADGTLWSVEQGSDRDDEVNLLRRGGDYGWHPVPGYNESVPMTDQSLPGPQQAARWRSGPSTLATSGGTFVAGRQWGALDGTLAVAVLKAQRVLFLTFGPRGALRKVRTPAALRQYGRIRQVSRARGGALLVTTDNGGGRDVVLKVTPR
ncbi:PQQ-dependent sugar dehydrogenase [Nocardioides sp. SYSU D00038]|uniref:PQQ-dependent sugar dehydrogenase n=1 Tax=Nocardioides sp. SYSU D00038 TaxID=2812554 RepID=UPI001967F06C|nr:PQQ-dependent sugar dehydrogenase [Nocardioides sp. SYSU D00038]